MKHTILATLGLALLGAALLAADLTYTTAPQTGDSDLVLRNKQAVAVARLERGNTYANITTAATNAVTASACVLDRLVINTAGSADATAVIKTGTNVVATVNCASVREVPYGVRLPDGLTVITAGTNAPDLTLSYR